MMDDMDPPEPEGEGSGEEGRHAAYLLEPETPDMLEAQTGNVGHTGHARHLSLLLQGKKQTFDQRKKLVFATFFRLQNQQNQCNSIRFAFCEIVLT
jgi:hypothetical protein